MKIYTPDQDGRVGKTVLVSTHDHHKITTKLENRNH